MRGRFTLGWLPIRSQGPATMINAKTSLLTTALALALMATIPAHAQDSTADNLSLIHI